MAVFALHYAGNIAYYQQLLAAENVVFEIKEHFVKQSFRTRMEILGPNGIQLLSIPTLKNKDRRVMDEVRISYAEDWQKDHWKGLEAAYRRSPYFEYYEDHLKPFYKEETELLVDFNFRYHTKICSLLKLEIASKMTESYEPEVADDFRSIPLSLSKPESYMQVFGDRNPYHANLSILDALFNLGPHASSVLI